MDVIILAISFGILPLHRVGEYCSPSSRKGFIKVVESFIFV